MENCFSYISNNCDNTYNRILLMFEIAGRLKDFFRNNRFEVICFSVVLIFYAGNKFLFIPFLPEGKLHLFFSCFFNDFLCPILFLPACCIILKWAGVNIQSYWLLLLLIVIGGLTWEYLIPLFLVNKVSDMIDIIFYLVGMNVYYVLMYMTERIVKKSK